MSRTHSSTPTVASLTDYVRSNRITPSRDGVTHVTKSALLVFAGWVGVAAADLLTDPTFDLGDYTAEGIPVAAAIAHHVFDSASFAQHPAMMTTPLLLLFILDLPRVRKLLAAIVAGSMVSATFRIGNTLQREIENAYVRDNHIQPEAVYFLTSAWDSFLTGIAESLFWALLITVPFVVAILTAQRLTGWDLVDV